MVDEKDMPWFRFYNETIDDRKLKTIARTLNMKFLVVLGAWSYLESLASASPRRGSLYVTFQQRYSNGDLGDMMGMTADEVHILINEFIDFGMIDQDEEDGYHLTNWEKRQFTSDKSTERVKKHRQHNEKPDTQAGAVTETLPERFSNVSVTAPETESESDTDTESLSVGVREFLKIAGLEKFPKGSESQVSMLADLIRQHGKEKTMSCAAWLWSKPDMTLRRAIKSMQTAVPGWTMEQPEGKGPQQARTAPARGNGAMAKKNAIDELKQAYL